MFRQYLAAKEKHPDAILLFRMGDFFEMFFEDAIVASKALELTLTTRGRGTAMEAPMCGIPFHAADSYIPRLVRMGHRVAVCDQTEDPKHAKGLVARDVVRVLSPGTMTDPDSLEPRSASYVAAVSVRGPRAGIALAELSTGEFLAWEGDAARGREVLAGYGPREILHAEDAPPPQPLLGDIGAAVLLSARPGWTFATQAARRTLLSHFRVASLDGFGMSDLALAESAAGALLAFLAETQKAPLEHIGAIRVIDTASCLVLDRTTRRNLEILRPLGDGPGEATLAGVLDLTMTSMGGRLLRDWLVRPLVEREAIEARLDAVGEILSARAVREALRALLAPLPDVERLLGRIAIRTAPPRDLVSVRRFLDALPDIRVRLAALESPLLRVRTGEAPDLSDLRDLLARAIADEPPTLARDGGAIRDGYDTDVDRWRAARADSRATIAALEAAERKRTGIGGLKVRYNSVFGYAIEVSRAHLRSVPPDYVRKQTLVGAERFVTPELKQLEQTLLEAETELLGREQRLYADVLDRVAARSADLRAAAGLAAECDVIASLAEAAERFSYARPRLTDEPVLRIADGRHPVVERLLREERFIPNDLTLDGASAQVIVLTGPNMGGKSTYLRQTALIVLMAQAGSFVPAASAEIGIADRIFCRVGASDNLAGGQSTFLVEMTETANILHSATHRSLVLLDEIGRGTSTFDGLSIAWAVAEWLHENPAARPRALFATHYHELTELELLFPRIRNFHMSAREYRDTVIFLRRVEGGPADRSYGIQVARLAGLPREVIARAREVLRNMESSEFGRDGLPALARRDGEAPDRGGSTQLPLFAPGGAPPIREIEAELRAADPDRLTPLEALGMIARWRRTIDEG